jgi:D-3-phosphoglycerate dehydrogenase / 2-oxoglutarate reductase
MPKVLIAPATLANMEGKWLDLLREAGLEPVFPPQKHQLLEDELLEQLRGVEAALSGSEPYSRRVIQAHPQLKVIARAGVGYDAVDVPAATEAGVAVTTTPGTNHNAVAELTFTLILALAKNLIPLHLSTKAGGWPRQTLIPLRGRTLGILGLGRIGKAVAERGAVFGMRMIAYEPFPDQAFVAKYGVTLMPLEQVLAEADFLTLHVPLSAESKYLINKKTLALMKSTAFLINTARGALVNEMDLAEALQTKRIAGAGIDVFETEPPVGCPLLKQDNIVVMPHVAGIDSQSLYEMAVSAARSIAILYKGGWPEIEVVNPAIRSRFKWR